MDTSTPTPTATPQGSNSTSLFDPLLDLIQPWVPLLVAVAVAAIVLAIATPILINRLVVWKEINGYSRLEAFCAPFKAIYRRIYKLIKKQEAPRPYRVIQPRELLQEKEKLMKHAAIKSALIAKGEENLWIVERGTYTKNIYKGSMWSDGGNEIVGTKEVPKSYHFDFVKWLSPYRNTVKDLTNETRNKYDSKKYRYLPRVQARIMADRLIVRKTTDTEALGLIQPKDADYKYGFFVIEIYATHSTPEEVLKLEPAIKAALKLDKLKQLEVTSNRVTWLALKPGVKTPLSNDSMPTGVEFIKQHPVDKHLGTIPLAITESGKPLVQPVQHTLLVGRSGSGKSSLLNMVCAQLTPAILDGRAEIYAIDPKANGEIRTQWARAGAFKMVGNADNIDEWVHIINVYYDLMESQPIDDTQLTKDTLGTQALKANTFKASKEKPLRILFIEELPSFVSSLKGHSEYGNIIDKINQILRKGRSLGFCIYSAAQNIERGELGGIDNKAFLYKMALALNGTDYINGLILGEDAAKRGYDARKLNPSPLNTEHCGLGYAKDDDSTPVMIRFPYFSLDQLVEVLLPLVEANTADSEATDDPAESADSDTPAPLDGLPEVDWDAIDNL